MYSKADRVVALVVTGSPIGRMMGVAALTSTKRKIQRRSRVSIRSSRPATLLSLPQAEVPALDAQDDAQGHRAGAQGRSDDDPRLGRPVRRVHHPLRQPAQELAR